jgi:hypothetical protein
VTSALATVQPDDTSDALAIAASLDAPSAFGAVFERHHAAVHRDMLRSTPIPDDLRAAFLRAAAFIPGIKLVSRERDVAGRHGVAVAFDYAGYRDALVFDRKTYRLLGETDRLVARSDYVDGSPGKLLGGSAYMESGIVTSQSARP